MELFSQRGHLSTFKFNNFSILPETKNMKIPSMHFPEFQFHRPELVKPLFSKPKDAPVDPSDSNAVQDQVLHRMGQGNRRRILGTLVTATRQEGLFPEMRDLAESMLATPAAGEVPQPNELAWPIISRFDKQRRIENKNCAAMLGNKTFQRIRKIASDANHPCQADAKLLRDIMTRPLGKDAPTLHGYLSEMVSEQVKSTIGNDFDTAPALDFKTREGRLTFVRTFNGIMQGLSLNSQDYASSAGRTLILKGAISLTEEMGEPSKSVGTADTPQVNEPLSVHLQKAAFCFPAEPMDNKPKLMLQDFDTDFNPEIMDMDPNPLEEKFGRDFYLDIKSYWPAT